MAQFKRGDQVAYIPTHAEGNIDHPDVEFGFVTYARDDTIFCRYWRRRELGVLRTRANSEGTPINNLVHHQSVMQGRIDNSLTRMQ